MGSVRDLWESLCRLIEYSCVNILPQITQITQRECSFAALFRRERQVVVSVVIVVIVVIVALGFGVCLRKSAGSARDIGGSFVD